MSQRKYFGWLDQEVLWSGLSVSGFGALAIAIAHYSGDFTNELFGLFLVLIGPGLIGYRYLQERAERIGSESARRQLKVANVLVGSIAVTLLVGFVALASYTTTYVFGFFVAPWLGYSYSSGRELLERMLNDARMLVAAGVVFATVTVAAAVEFVYRRRFLTNGQVTGEILPWYEAFPEVTLSVGAALALVTWGAVAAVLGFGLIMVLLTECSARLPMNLGGMLIWLDQHRSIKWALPAWAAVLLVTAGLQRYRRAQLEDDALALLVSTAYRVSMTCIALTLLAAAAFPVGHYLFGCP